jgi:hypothetical protein
MPVTFNVDELTLGQAEFLCDYTGRSIESLQEACTSGDLGIRDLVAILALTRNPADPQAAVAEIRAMKVSDISR